MSYRTRRLAILALVVIISLLPGAAFAQGRPLQQVDTERIDAYIQSRMQTTRIPGLALGVVHGDQVVYLQGYGIAGPDGRAVTPQTPFILGSTSKSITALAVMQLVEAGKINLDAPVTAYLPWFRTSDAATSAQITVRNLLNQDSGLPTYEGRLGFGDNDQSMMALENGIRDLSSVQMRQPVGQGFEYANENYDLLGLLIQTVSGNSYEDYVRSAIFAPLQMHHSATTLSDPAAIDMATGYRYWFLWPLPFDAPYPRRMTPSGFLVSSAEDMTHYLIAQLNEGSYGTQQLLSPEGIAALHRPGPLSSYAMGWVVEGESGASRIWHNGDTSNFHSNLLLLPDQHIGIVTLVNIGGFTNSGATNIPIEGVAEILLGNSLSASSNPPSWAVLPVLLLAALLLALLWIAGSYLSIRRWYYRGELPAHGARRFWQFYLPLAFDLCPLILLWIFVPKQFQTPVVTLALFAPDVFVAILTLSTLSVSWAILRTYFTLRPHVLMTYASR